MIWNDAVYDSVTDTTPESFEAATAVLHQYGFFIKHDKKAKHLAVAFCFEPATGTYRHFHTIPTTNIVDLKVLNAN